MQCNIDEIGLIILLIKLGWVSGRRFHAVGGEMRQWGCGHFFFFLFLASRREELFTLLRIKIRCKLSPPHNSHSKSLQHDKCKSEQNKETCEMHATQATNKRNNRANDAVKVSRKRDNVYRLKGPCLQIYTGTAPLHKLHCTVNIALQLSHCNNCTEHCVPYL